MKNKTYTIEEKLEYYTKLMYQSEEQLRFYVQRINALLQERERLREVTETSLKYWNEKITKPSEQSPGASEPKKRYYRPKHWKRA